MGPQPEHTPQEEGRGPERPHPSEPFYLEKLLEHVNAHRDLYFVVRGRREWLRESLVERQARVREGGLRNLAYDAWRQSYFAGGSAPFDSLLERLFPSNRGWATFGEARRSNLREALHAVLEEGWKSPHVDPAPWADPESPSPERYLADRVYKRSIDIYNEREQADKFATRTAEAPLGPDRLRELKGWGGNADGGMEISATEGRRVAGWRHDIGTGRDHDPGEAVSDKRPEWIRAIERIAEHGRPANRPRARKLLQALGEQWDTREAKEAVGGDDAWRALKTAARNELRKTEENS